MSDPKDTVHYTLTDYLRDVLEDGTATERAVARTALAILKREDGAESRVDAARDEVKRLQAAHAAQQERVRVLTEALEEARRAIGDHHAPGDCYATGPMTGDPIRDFVQCPACSAIAMYDAARSALSIKEKTDA